MKKEKKYLAIDIGASNVKVIVGLFNGSKLKLKEIYRFSNNPVTINKRVYLDVLAIYSEIISGISKANYVFRDISSIGIDTFGCVFGLLNKNKLLISNCIHSRDRTITNINSKIFEIIPKEIIYKKTQCQLLPINTLYQLYSLKLNSGYL